MYELHPSRHQDSGSALARSRTGPVGRSALVGIGLALLLALPAFGEGIERTFEVAPGGRLAVDASGASVSVKGTTANRVQVAVTRGTDSAADIERDYEVNFNQSKEGVTIEIKSRRRFQIGFRRGLEVTVEVPSRYNAEIASSGGSVAVRDLTGEIGARTSGGSLRFEDIDGAIVGATSGGSVTVAQASGDVDVTTSGGSVKVGEVDGKVTAKTSGGSISIKRAGAGVVAETSGGWIEVSEVRGPIQASTSGGSIRAFLAEQPTADSRLSTSGGSVTVTVAEGLALDIDARASGGGVKSDLAVKSSEDKRDRLVGSLNGGGPQLVVRASGGSVRLERGR